MNKKMNGYLRVGLILTGFLAALILLGMFWTPYDPQSMSVGPKLAGPSLHHLMGTDKFGRDIFSRVLQGAGATVSIALATVAIGGVDAANAHTIHGVDGICVVSAIMGAADPAAAARELLKEAYR